MSKTKNQKPKVPLDINHIAKLANLSLTAEEKKIFHKQLPEILDYIQSLDELDTSKVEPVGQITGLSNVRREDNSTPSLSQEEALANVKKKHNGFVEVEAILEEL